MYMICTFLTIVVHILYYVNIITNYYKSEIVINIGNKLKELRAAEGWTQAEVAERINTSRVNYTRYETGKVRPDYEMLIALADVFEISLDELFDRPGKL